MKKPIYRDGDRVRVLVPNFVTRVGYPRNVDYYKPEARQTLESVGLLKPSFDGDWDTARRPYTIYDRAKDKLIGDLARFLLIQKGWGGNERSIYTQSQPLLAGTEQTVIDKRVVKTGKRYSGYTTYDAWNGDYDYDPGGLEDEKTHILLKLATPGHFGIIGDRKSSLTALLKQGGWIESINVEHVRENVPSVD